MRDGNLVRSCMFGLTSCLWNVNCTFVFDGRLLDSVSITVCVMSRMKTQSFEAVYGVGNLEKKI